MKAKAILFLPITYLVAVSVLLVSQGIWFSPDQFFAAALIIALILGRSKQFVLDWSVPVMLLVSYDYLRGLAPKLTQAVNIYPMIYFDKIFFGNLPTNSLQSLLHTGKGVHWYDYLGTFLYFSHFITPMLIGFIFWLKSRDYFKSYFFALLLLSYSAFVTYIIFPAMPPWMAAEKGIIPQVAKIMDAVFANLAHPISLPSLYKFVGVNLVAAVPSLHAAYPWLTFLFVAKKSKLLSLLILPYVLGIWFSIVYFGEHYVFDIVVGVLYATATFGLVLKGDWIQRKAFLFFYFLSYNRN